MQPLVSIILCTYNGEAFIEEQIKSLLQQTYANIEIIVSDDASSDATTTIIERYLTDNRVHLYKQPVNLGYIKNFETAVAKAHGNYIAFCDQDDIWLPGKIETLYNHIADYLLVYCDSELIDENGNSLNKRLSHVSKMYTGTDTRGFVFWNVVWGHAMLVRKELLLQSLPIPEQIPHDIWLAVKACTLGGIKYVDEVLTYYRQHAKTVTKTTYKKPANIGSRTLNKRYEEYLQKLNWIKHLRDIEHGAAKEFYAKLAELYSKKEKGGFVWSLFFFMLKNRKSLFMFREKKWISQVIELRKQSRSIKK